MRSEWIPLLTNSTHCYGLPLLQIPRLLKCKRHLQHTPIVVIPSHNLYSDRQPAFRVLARYRRGRIPCCQIVAAPASRLAYSHPSPPPSALSCVPQCPLSGTTWLPPRVEAAERARKRLHTLTCYPPSCRNGGATQIGSKRTFQVKLIDGLTSSRVLTAFAVHA